MKSKFVQFAALITSLVLICSFCSCFAATAGNPDIMRVGLSYGDSALTTANLENSVGSGYRFGYFDSSLNFIQLGYTAETKLSVLKTQNIYLASDASYTTTATSNGAVGCYHLQLPETYSDFATCNAAADAVTGGFPAYISGTYYVRVGAYTSNTEAQTAQKALGKSSTVCWTSSYAASVTKTGTTTILFQFDGGDSQSLGIKPGLDDSQKTQTWFKGYKYYGSFRYQRISGGNLTVVNIVSLDDYIKGVLPYEMSSSWPLEALKAQAVCARSYATSNGTKHSSYGFDVCSNTDCQVYHGTNSSNAKTDQAVDQTAGLLALYNGQVCNTVYYSCNGGASESSENVWSTAYPYLRGVADPYEADIVSKVSQYNWTVTYTADDLKTTLNNAGYQCSSIVNFYVSKFTDTGNVYSITILDSNGKTWTFSKQSTRTFFGLRSQRYNIAGSGGQSTGSTYYVDTNGSTLSSLQGAYAINGSGAVSQISGSSIYAVTGSGTSAVDSGTTSSGGATSYTITGSGWGHNVGLSQWGAYAMANRGITYDKILNFYYTGITIGTK
jgi:stage II sporulation protein D